MAHRIATKLASPPKVYEMKPQNEHRSNVSVEPPCGYELKKLVDNAMFEGGSLSLKHFECLKHPAYDEQLQRGLGGVGSSPTLARFEAGV